MKKKTVIIIIVSIIVVLVALRIALPYIVKDYVNKTLDEIEGYQGHVADIDISLIRGAYQIKGVEIEETSGKVPVPFFSADVIDLSVEWSALLKGSVVGEIEVYNPKINFVAGAEEKDVEETGENWQDKVRELFPLRINRFQIIDGEVHYRNFTSDPQVNVYLSDLMVTATNITNSEKISESMVAKLKAEGTAMDQGKFNLSLDYDPYAQQPTFDLTAELEGVQLTKLNDFLKAYGNFDVQKGTFGLYTEFAASEGKFDGYVKPLIHDIEVFSWEADDRNFLEKMWEAVVGVVAGVVENPEEEQIGTVVPVSGRFDDPDVNIWSTIGTLLRNAFIEALIPGVERSIEIKDPAEKEE
jgi:uncharacterized protein involved in outer membrane biogenesis